MDERFGTISGPAVPGMLVCAPRGTVTLREKPYCEISHREIIAQFQIILSCTTLSNSSWVIKIGQTHPEVAHRVNRPVTSHNPLVGIHRPSG